jgi:hypothetical protein
MNNKGWINIAEKLALIDIAEYQNKTIKNRRQKASKGLLVSASRLYDNGKTIRKQNKELYETT